LILFKRQQRLQLRAHTHQVIKEDLIWPRRILSILREIKGRDISPIFMQDSELRQDLREALDYCENISLGIRHGVYDEETIRDSYAKLFVVLYAQVERLIHELRYESNDPETYGAFTAIVKKWQYDSKYGRKL
ncbi:hypothetical protein LCGC14_3146710, partial [marine sediment metagenome]